MFSNYVIKKSEFCIHFENGYFVIIEIPETNHGKKSFVEELRELFVGDSSDIVTIKVFDNCGMIVKSEEGIEPFTLVDLLSKVRNM